MKEDDKNKRRKVLFWYYTITELFSPEEDHDQNIKDGIKFLRTYHNNKYKRKLKEKSLLIERPRYAAALVKLALEIPQEIYGVDFQEKLEGYDSWLGNLPHRPSVNFIVNRYKHANPKDLILGEANIKELDEIYKLILRMVPDDPKEKFLKYIEELKKEGDPSTNADEAKKVNKVDRDIVLLNNQLSVAHNVGKKQGIELVKLRKKTKYSLRHLSDEQLERLAYETRKKNGKPHFSKMGERLGCHHTTIKNELKRRNLLPLIFDYIGNSS